MTIDPTLTTKNVSKSLRLGAKLLRACVELLDECEADGTSKKDGGVLISAAFINVITSIGEISSEGTLIARSICTALTVTVR